MMVKSTRAREVDRRRSGFRHTRQMQLFSAECFVMNNSRLAEAPRSLRSHELCQQGQALSCSTLPSRFCVRLY